MEEIETDFLQRVFFVFVLLQAEQGNAVSAEGGQGRSREQCICRVRETLSGCLLAEGND